jgi:BED zinc finger
MSANDEKKSFVWKFFSKDGNKAKCVQCFKSLKTTGATTSNLIYHLKTHGISAKSPEITMVNKTIEECMSKPFSQDEFLKLLAIFVVQTDSSFRLLESRPAEKLFNKKLFK